MENENIKIKLNEMANLLNQIMISGAQNIFIMSNVLARLQFVLEELNKGIEIDNTRKEKQE
jgi:hypothetical protein